MYFTFTKMVTAYGAIAQISFLKLEGPKQNWCHSWQSTLAWDASSSWRKVGAPRVSAGGALCGGASLQVENCLPQFWGPAELQPLKHLAVLVSAAAHTICFGSISKWNIILTALQHAR